MKSLMIKDLAVTAELDSRAMSTVRGGNAFYLPGYNFSQFDLSVSAQQLIGQTQNVFNENGSNVAFSEGIGSNVKPVQKANNSNTLNVFGG
jgi:hypothetical protein